MKMNTRLGLAAVLAAMIAAPVAFAQETAAPGQMMQGQDAMPRDMQSGDMSGMQGMMPMMKMMEQCTEMMAAMTDHMKATPQTQDDNG